MCQAVCLLWLFVALASARAATLPSQFIEENIGGTWNEAVGLVFAPDGRMFVWERGGRVWTVENGVRSAQPFLDISEEVAVWNNYGLLGFCLHPDFGNNGQVYLLYVADRHHVRFFGTGSYDPEETETHVATVGRITRYTARAADGFRTVDPASRRVLVGQTLTNGFPLVSGQHGVGTILFGTDGTLLASCGDGASSSITDIGSGSGTYWSQALADGIIRPAENVGAYRCQMVDSLSGKIIRIDPNTGEGLPSNPFYDPAAPGRPASRVWALGLKTPSRLILRPGTGEHNPALGQPGVLYIGDVGWNDWEDLHICDRPGLNFGWPAYEGMEIQPDYYNANVANQDAPNPLHGTSGCNRPFFYFRELIRQDTLGVPSWPNPCNVSQQIPASIPRFVHARPVIDWGHSGPARVAIYSGTNAATINVGASGSPVAGASFSGACSMGGVWYTGTDFPETWRNTYFHFDYEAQWIKNFIFDTNNRPVQVRNFATAAGGVVFVTSHPAEGGLYYITWDSTVRRIRYVAGSNQPPVAVAQADRRFGPGPLAVQFTGANSTDPENLPLAYRWDFGDGTPAATNANPLHVFEAPAGVPTRYEVTLRVTDRSGATNSATLPIFVNNTPPSVTILTPTNGTRYPMTNDTRYDCTAAVTDAEHGPGQLAWAWQTFLHHNNHIHSEPVDTNEVTSTILAPEGCDGQTYFYRIVLTVTDPLGLSSSNEVRLFPDCPVVTTNAPPPGTNAPPAGTNTPPAGSGATLDPALPPGSNFDLSHWYLGTPDAERSLSIPVAELMAGYTSAWFYTGPDGAMVFWAPVTGGTTSGSSYPRSELREQINPPDNSINWTVFGTHLLEAQCRVRVLPSNGKIIIGQIHGYLGDARPLLKLLFDNGRIDAQVKESPSADTDLHVYFPNTPLKSLITYRVVLEEGLLTITINGISQTIDILDNDPEWADQTFYFKAGSYVQDNSGTSAEGGRVDFYQLHSAHANYPPTPPVLVRSPVAQSAPVGSNVVLSVSAAGGLPMSYHWFKDGAPLPGADQSILSIRGVQAGHAGFYHAIASNAAGIAVSGAGQLTVLPSLPAFTLAEALDTTNFVWTTTGTPAWHGWFGAAHDGLDQAQSGLIDDGQSVSMQTTVTGPGQVRFWWKVSSQTNDDYLTFYIGSSQQARISGSVDWQERAFNVPSGSQVLRWTYAKGDALAASSDRAWVDEVRFGPQPAAIVTHPTNRLVDAGATVSFTVAATGAAPLTYRWQCQGTNLIETDTVRGTTTPTLTLSNVQPAQAGAYQVTVANAASTVTSSNALLAVNTLVPLPEAIDAGHLVWITNGTPPWVGQTAVQHDGRHAARSGAIGHSATTSFQTTVNGPGTLAFWWKVSSEPSNDRLLLYRGSTELARISGEVDWQFRTFAIPAGSQTLRWTYSKNSSTVRGQDRAWVDEIRYDPLLPPEAPAGLAAIAASMSQVNLAWTDRSAAETAFLVERSTNGTNFSQIATLGSNTVSFLSTGLLASSTYQFRVRATNAAGFSAYSPAAGATTLPFTGARINFQPASAPVPPGYLVDSGQSFGPRGNGLSYGWNSSRTSSATDRNSSRSPDQRHDTFISSGTSTGTRWELQVPNDQYHVFLVAGDAGSSSGTHRYGLEALTAIWGSVTTSNRWLSNRLNVTVTDGRLSISNLAGASNNKLCFVDITRLTPLLACAPDKTAECGRPWSFDKPTAQADPCNGSIAALVVAGTVTNGTSPCAGPLRVTRTWLATDSCGNSNTCSQTVTLLDTTAPVLVCGPARTVERGSTWDFDTPTATDSCAGASVTLAVLGTTTNTAGFCPGTFAATRTWSATDGCGNSNVCSQTITMRDTTPPLLGCAPGRTVEAGVDWTFDAPMTDGTLAVVQTATNTMGSCPGGFTATRTWSATDACGNSNACSQTITVIDTTVPLLACPADRSVEAGAWAFETPSATDAAGGTVTVAVVETTTNKVGFCEGTFTVTRIWSATDPCGNSNTCAQTVTVLDTTAPALVCPADKTIEAGTGWDFDEPAWLPDLGSGTNVVLTVLGTVTNATGFCEGAFTATRTWSAADTCGNSNTCSQTVTVRDTTGPALACPADRSVEAGVDWDFDAPPAPADLVSTNVVLALLGTTTNTLGFCEGTFAATRTWSATDGCGNSNLCSQTITVRDTTPPLLGCAPGRTVSAGSDWAFDPPAAPTDAVSGTNVLLVIAGTETNAIGFCAGSFVVTRSWLATDACGNSNTCSQTITVLDTTPPSLSCLPDKTAEAGAAWDFDPPLPPLDAATKQVALVILGTVTNTAGFCEGTWTATRTWLATDACGNSNACSQTVSVLDSTPPLLSCAPDRRVEAGAAWEFDVPAAADAGSGTHVTFALLGESTNTVGLCEGAFAVTRTWSASDACGNSNVCSQTITVVPAAPPLLVCAPDKVVEPGMDWTFDPPTALVVPDTRTNLTLAVLSTRTNRAGFCAGTFVAIRTWSATDACGNSNTCSQTVTLVDTTPPVLVCADLVTCDPNASPLPPATDLADPTPQVTCRRADDLPWGSPFPPGTNTVSCTATDACTNTATCQFRIIVPAPLVTSGPTNQTVCLGSEAMLVATVDAGEARAVRWKFNDALLPEATNLVLSFPVTGLGQAGEYRVEIDGPCGTVLHAMTLTVSNCTPAIAAVERCTLTQGFFTERNAAAVSFLSSLLTGDLVLGQPGLRSLTVQPGDLAVLLTRLPAQGPATALPDNGDQFLATATLALNDKSRFSNALLGHAIALGLSLRFDPGLGDFALAESFCTMVSGEVRTHAIPATVLAALSDPALGITNATVNGLMALGQRTLAGLGSGTATADEVAAALQAVGLAFDGCRTAVSCPPGLPTVPLNDAFASRLPIAGAASGAPSRTTTRLGHNTGASADPDEPAHATTAARRSVWWEFTPAESGWVRVHTGGSSFDTVLAVYTGGSLAFLAPVAANDDGDTAVSSILFFVNAGTAYQIAVDGYAGDSGNVVLNILEGVTP